LELFNMTLKTNIETIEITSKHMGYITINRCSDEVSEDVSKPIGVWLEIRGCDDYPLVIETVEDLNELAKQILECKKLFK